MINSILLSKIRPAIMQDGGDVKFIKYESGTAYLSLKGVVQVAQAQRLH